MNRYPSIGRVGALAVALGVGSVIAAPAATQTVTGTETARPALAYHVAPARASVALAAKPVAALPETAVFAARTPERASYTHSTARGDRPDVVLTGHRDTAYGADLPTDSPPLTLSDSPAKRDVTRTATPSTLARIVQHDTNRSATQPITGLQPNGGADLVTALVSVFVGNGDEPGENGGLLIGNGAPGAPGQDGGRGGLLFGNGGRGGDGLTGQKGGNGGDAGVFGDAGNGGRGGNAATSKGTALGGDAGDGGTAVFGSGGSGGEGGYAISNDGAGVGGTAGDGGDSVASGSGGNGGAGGTVIGTKDVSYGGEAGAGGDGGAFDGDGGQGGAGGNAASAGSTTQPGSAQGGHGGAGGTGTTSTGSNGADGADG